MAKQFNGVLVDVKRGTVIAESKPIMAETIEQAKATLIEEAAKVHPLVRFAFMTNAIRVDVAEVISDEKFFQE